MVYCISDLHGRYDLYEKLLEQLKMTENDRLYILGDCADRGPDGVKIWLDTMTRENVVLLKGNHEGIALKNLIPLGWREKTDKDLTMAQLEKSVEYWVKNNGGHPTITAFLDLSEEKKKELLQYLNNLPLFVEIQAMGKNYFLSHTVPPYRKGMDLKKCSEHALTWEEPDYEKVYDRNLYLVTGHTPTQSIEFKPEQKGIIWQRNHHIAIDCSLADGGRLGCFCPDTGEVFYVE